MAVLVAQLCEFLPVLLRLLIKLVAPLSELENLLGELCSAANLPTDGSRRDTTVTHEAEVKITLRRFTALHYLQR